MAKSRIKDNNSNIVADQISNRLANNSLESLDQSLAPDQALDNLKDNLEDNSEREEAKITIREIQAPKKASSLLRADALLQASGLVESREKAKRLIMAGQVLFATTKKMAKKGQKKANDPKDNKDNLTQFTLVTKPGQQLALDTEFKLVESERFVSRGAYKLLTIIEHFQLDLANKVCLDLGASTGGFTDCLLQHGAKRVYAIDVGKNQLHEKIRNDARVISLEGINLRYIKPELIPEKADLAVADLSFISLTLIIPAILPLLKSEALLALLIKPQFELGPGQNVKGIVKDEKARQEAVNKIVNFCQDLNLSCLGIVPAAIKGSKGNQEYLSLFKNKVTNFFNAKS